MSQYWFRYLINSLVLCHLLSNLLIRTTAVDHFSRVGQKPLLTPCGRCSDADEGTVSLWANFSAWNSRSQFDGTFAAPCNSSISVRGGRMHPSEFSLGLLQVLTRQRDYKDIDPYPRPNDITVMSSSVCTMCRSGNFAIDTSDDAFIIMNSVGYEENLVAPSAEGIPSSLAALLISFVDDHFVHDWGSFERVFEPPEQVEPVEGLDAVHWAYESVVRPHRGEKGEVWLYFKTEGYGSLFRAESTNDGRSWGPRTQVQLVGGSVHHAYGVTANENPRRVELGEPNYLLVGDCPQPLYAEYKHKHGTNLWTACVFGSADGLRFELLANPATSSWAKRDYQIADSVNEIRWCPSCQSHVLSSRYAPESPKKWRHIRGVGYWRNATVTSSSSRLSTTPLFDLDTWIKFDMQGPLELHRRQMYGTSGSWIDGIYHGLMLQYTIPDEVAFRDRAPPDRMKIYFFTSRDMRNFTFTSIYARHPILGHDLDMWSVESVNSLVRTEDRWGLLHASLAMTHQRLAGNQPSSLKNISIAWWKQHRMTGLRSITPPVGRSCFAFLATKWIRLDPLLIEKRPVNPSPLNFKINCKCDDGSFLHMGLKLRPASGTARSERVVAKSKPLEGDLVRARVYWQITESGTPFPTIDFSKEEFSLFFTATGECTVYSVILDS